MTREEEILKQTNIYTSDSLNYTAWCDVYREYDDIEFVEQAFISGAKWADKTMIEKACNWIKEHVMIPHEGKFDSSETPITDYLEWCKDRLEEAERVANEFKKAMEE